MKKLLLGAVALTMLATACKKDDGGSSTPSGVTINGTNYALLSSGGITKVSNTVLIAGLSGSNGGTLTFEFPGSATPAAGTYKVVADSTGTVAANTVSFVAAAASGSSATYYGSTGAGTVNVTVTNNSGKIGISMPDAPAKAILGGSGTATVSCNASE